MAAMHAPGRSICCVAFAALLASLAGCGANGALSPAPSCLAAGAPAHATLWQTLRGGVTASDPLARAPSPAPGHVAFLQPVQVAVSGNDLFVADLGRRELLRIDRGLQTVSRFVPLPAQGGALAVDRWSSVYLIEPGLRRVVQYRRDGSLAQTYADPGSLTRPVDVVADATERVYVADAAGARVVVFNRLGQVTRLIGERGDRPNPFRSITALAASAHGLYVLDALAQRVHALDYEGAARFGFEVRVLRQPAALAVDRHERVFVADAGAATVWMFEPARAGGLAGRRLEGVRLERPGDLWIDDAGFLYVADAHAGVLTLTVPPPCR